MALPPVTELPARVVRLMRWAGWTVIAVAMLVTRLSVTVDYVTSLLQKLGVRNRTQAALRAHELGLLDASDSGADPA